MNKFYDENTIAVITGASSGIGKELTKILISKYNSVVIGIGRSEEKLSKLNEELGNNFIPYQMDVSINENFEKLNEFLQGKNLIPNVIINCAGVLPEFSKFNEAVFENAKKVFDINFFSILYSANTFLPVLKTQNKPLMINVLSSSALCPFAGVSLYSSSKSAGERFSECLAFENKNVKIATVMPGFTKTNVLRSQNATSKELGIIDKISAPADKVAKIILKKSAKGKKRIIIGFDAHLMNFLFKFFPNTAPKLITWFLKKSKMQIFNKI